MYEERFERRSGFFRPHVKEVIYRYLDCEVLHNGFARIRCKDCAHEYLLLSELSRCGWESLKAYLNSAVRDSKAVPGAAIAIQTFGDFLGFNPHLHVLISDGCFHESGMRKKAGMNEIIPSLLEPEMTDRAFRKNWSRFTRLWRADSEGL